MPLQLHGDITGLLDVLEKEQALKHNLQNSFSSPLQFALELLSLPTGVMNTADLPEPVQTPKSEPKSPKNQITKSPNDQNRSYITGPTPPVLHRRSYTTGPTSPVLHYRSYITGPTQPVLHHRSYTTGPAPPVSRLGPYAVWGRVEFIFLHFCDRVVFFDV